mmetsp:Transcript_7421/g.16902  ORF Transcript_7421/g.16902 Transcript_7421/m.16902 type:complete len:90 (+) Transcript_7421:19-288(+)
MYHERSLFGCSFLSTSPRYPLLNSFITCKSCFCSVSFAYFRFTIHFLFLFVSNIIPKIVAVGHEWHHAMMCPHRLRRVSSATQGHGWHT